MENTKQLGTEPVGKLLLKFSLPAIVGMLVSALYNVVDRIFIGQGVGTKAIAGLTITFPIMMLVIAFGLLIGNGATSLISIHLGKGDKQTAEVILGNSITMLFIIGIAYTIFGLATKDSLLTMFGASADILPYASQYLGIILFGVLFQMVSMGMNNFIRADGNPKTAMTTMLIGAGINILLDPLFIFVFKMGVRGAAIATIISQFISAVWVMKYFFGGNSQIKVHKINLSLKKDIVLKVLAIGSAPFAIQVASSVISIIYNRSLTFYGGDIAITVYGIINSVVMFVLMPIFGINQGAQPIIGYNYGAKQYSRVKKALKLSMLAATGVVVVSFIVTQLAPSVLIKVFNSKDAELLRIGSVALKTFTVMFPLIGFQIVASTYFQAIGKPKHALVLSTSRQILFLIPALLLLPKVFGLNGIWYAAPTSDFISFIVTSIFIYREIKSLPDDGMDLNNKVA